MKAPGARITHWAEPVAQYAYARSVRSGQRYDRAHDQLNHRTTNCITTTTTKAQ